MPRTPLTQALTGIAAAVAPESTGPVRAIVFEKDGVADVLVVTGNIRAAMPEAEFRERFGERATIRAWIDD